MSYENHLANAKTASFYGALERLGTHCQVGTLVHECYKDGPSLVNQHRKTIQESRFRDAMARHVAALGEVTSDGDLLPSVKKSNRRRPGQEKRIDKRIQHQLTNPGEKVPWKHGPLEDPVKIILFEGDLRAPHHPGIKGQAMPLGKIMKALQDLKYVEAVVPVNECRTSMECYPCAVKGTGADLVQKYRWREEYCPQCGTHYHRDLVAACNILYVGAYQLEHCCHRPRMYGKRSKPSKKPRKRTRTV